ncbi:MAG TPA: hypothetical protein PLM07_05825, partial [Candidatus Rifleibacterium sp.]|nr:hypothetical protein [Candidatus Rifleibacterium sp.]HPT45402.1 hypothetical protein [Candidatus Rifleibacterium sp.]
ALTVPFGTSVTALTPTITHTGASIAPASEVAQNFTSPVTYTVTAADNSTQAYTVTVTKAAAPMVSAPTSTPQNLKSGDSSTSTVQMNVPGNIYLVETSQPMTTQSELDAAVSANKGFVGMGSVLADTAYTITVAAGLLDGLYDIVGVDAAGNVSPKLAGWLTVDNTVPTVVLADNHPDAVVREADSVTITATFVEGNAINETTPPTISIGNVVTNAAMTKSDNLNWVYVWAVPAGNDGVHVVAVSATDLAGNANAAATGQTTLQIDNTGPTVELTDDQTDPDVLFGETVLITATFADADQIDTISPPTITIGMDVVDQPMMSTGNNSIWTFSWAVPSATIGGQPVSITAQDASGNTNSPATGRTSYNIPAPKAITAFDFLSPSVVIGDIDEGLKTISLVVPYGTNVTSLLPTITHTGTSISPNESMPQDFTTPVVYTVTGSDALTESYTVTVTQEPINYYINTQAGAVRGADGSGGAADFHSPMGVCVDSTGDVYVAEAEYHTIRKITSSGVASTLAGTPDVSGGLDGTGSSASFTRPGATAVDASGNLYVADTNNHTIRKITPGGVVSTLAGLSGNSGSADDNGSGARFNSPSGVAVDINGFVFVADTGNHTIRKIAPNGDVTTLAGSAGLSGTADQTGSLARFNNPFGIAVHSSGNLFVGDSYNHTIRQVSPAGVVTTFAGTAGVPGSADGTGTAASFNFPEGVAVDSSGNVYVADSSNHKIRYITVGGVVSTLSGTGTSGYLDGSAGVMFSNPSGVCVDSSFNVYVTDYSNSAIRKISSGMVSTLAGAPRWNDETGNLARFYNARDVAVDSYGNIYVADTDNHVIRKVVDGDVVTTFAGLGGVYGSDDGPGNLARFNSPTGITVDSADNVYVADKGNHTIRMITSSGVVSTLAGLAGSSGSTDGSGNAARFNQPYGVALDSSNNVYVADYANHLVRKISGGVVTTLAGSGVSGSIDGNGSAAYFSYPKGVAVDSNGFVYVTDSAAGIIRKVSPGGVVTTLAGTAGNLGHVDATGASAAFASPDKIAVDDIGYLYVTDMNTIRHISPAGVVVTLAGAYNSPGIGDGYGSSARFVGPAGIAVDSTYQLFISDSNTVRRGGIYMP